MVSGTTSETKERCPSAKRAFNSQGEVIQLACDQWLCDHCAKVLAWRWAERVRYGIALGSGREPWFWTITLPAWVPDAATGFRVLPGRWDNLRKALMRQNPTFLYAAFVEGHPHRANIPHFHIITLSPAPRRLKDMVVHAGFGYQAKELEINGKVAVNYVCKYASKGPSTFPRNFRRVRISQAWPKLPTPVYEYQVYPLDRREALSTYLRRMSTTLGYTVELLRDRWLDHSRDLV